MKWRQILWVLCLAVSASSVLAGSGTLSITTTNSAVKGIPAAGMLGATSFATNTAYTQGQYASHEGRIFMALNAGTSGVGAPSGSADSSDGTITWRSALSRRRLGVVIVNMSTGVLYVAEASLPVGAGVPLIQYGAAAYSGPETPQGEFWFTLVGGVGSVSTMEW